MRIPLLMACCLSICNLVTLAVDPPAKSPLEQRLSRIIIPKIELREATFAESLDFILHKVRELDPTGRGIKTTLQLEAAAGAPVPAAPATGSAPSIPGLDPPKTAAPAARLNPADARLTVSLSNIPAFEALKYITALANLKFRIDGDTVHIIPMDAAATPPASPRR